MSGGSIKEQLKSLVELESNSKCADCLRRDTEWASTNLGCFLCIHCSGVHRGLGVTLSKVKSIKLDSWDLKTLEVMENAGNKKVNAEFEHCLPEDYPRPVENDPLAFIGYFIRQKYEKRAFAKPENEDDLLPSDQLAQRLTHHAGWLSIKRKKGGKRRIWAVLNQLSMLVFAGQDCAPPAELINIENCTIEVVVDENDAIESSTKTFFLDVHALGDPNKVVERIICTADTSVDFASFVQAMRFAKIRYARPVDVVSTALPTPVHGFLDDVTKSGWMDKQGGKIKTWRHRLFVLSNRYLCYYKEKSDSIPTGTILIDDSVVEKCPKPHKKGSFAFYVRNSRRAYILEVETEEEMEDWMKKIMEQKEAYCAAIELMRKEFEKRDITFPLDAISNAGVLATAVGTVASVAPGIVEGEGDEQNVETKSEEVDTNEEAEDEKEKETDTTTGATEAKKGEDEKKEGGNEEEDVVKETEPEPEVVKEVVKEDEKEKDESEDAVNEPEDKQIEPESVQKEEAEATPKAENLIEVEEKHSVVEERVTEEKEEKEKEKSIPQSEENTPIDEDSEKKDGNEDFEANGVEEATQRDEDAVDNEGEAN